MQETFSCADCGETKDVLKDGGTGYATVEGGGKVCYNCCANRDKAQMEATGRATLYLDMTGHPQVTNWPGTLRFKCCDARQGKHNMAGTRYDVWFLDENGLTWHGVQYGENSQLCHCKRLK